jgi:tetratricopeptide (TPR) repeat protein
MKKVILSLAVLFAVTCFSHAQEINELPMYGGKQKTADEIRADSVFVAWAVKAFGSREKAADDAVRRGFRSLSKADWRMAMKRFNQAWLLSPDKPEVMWGFGAALSYQGKFEESEASFQKALVVAPKNGHLLTDFGFLYQFWATKGTKDKTQKAQRLDRSVGLFDQAAHLEPSYDRIYFDWAVSLFFKQDYKGAWQKISEAEKHGGKSIDQKFIADLTKKMPRP